MRQLTPSEGPPGGGIVSETLIAIMSAGAAAYVRARQEPQPLTCERLGVLCAEAVVCGFIAVGLASAFSLDGRASTGVAAALGLIGTGVLSDLLTRWLKARADKG